MVIKEKMMHQSFLYKVILLTLTLLYIIVIFRSPLINDDYMALYSSWLLSEGKIPNLDYHVDSYSLLFDLMSYFYYFFDESFYIVYIFRFVFLFILFYVFERVYRISRLFFSVKISFFNLLFLVLSSVMYVRGLDLRPDPIISLLWLQVFFLLFVYNGNEFLKMFYVGLIIGFSVLFKFKAAIIGIVPAVYIISLLFEKKKFLTVVFYGGCILLGFLLTHIIFFLLFGVDTLDLYLTTTIKLILLSTHKSSNYGFVFFYSWRDFIFFTLSFFGVLRFLLTFKKVDPLKIKFFTSLLIVSFFSIYFNPQYFSYNLTVLYPMISFFSAFLIEYIFIKCYEESRKPIVLYILLAISFFLMISYVYEKSMFYQFKLNEFIKNNLESDEALFAFEGIGLYQPSTYHWRSSYIMMSKYYSAEYSIFDEIKDTSPVLIIENYRIPNWLTQEEKTKIYSYYTTLAPMILTLGIVTKDSKTFEVLKSGKYRVEAEKGSSCSLDGVMYNSGDVLELSKGYHFVKVKSGQCKIIWFFPIDEVEKLKASNVNHRPYLISP